VARGCSTGWRGGISYADCFAVATAKRQDAPLLTGDLELLALALPAESM